MWGTGTPKDKDEVNRRDVSECDEEEDVEREREGVVCMCERVVQGRGG